MQERIIKYVMLKTCNAQDIDLKTRLYISKAAEINEENAYYAFII